MTSTEYVLRLEETGDTLPIVRWLLYAHVLVAPFFVYSVLFGRDIPSQWVVASMAVIFALEFTRTGGRFVADRTFLYLFLFFLAYGLSTFQLVLTEPVNTVLNRAPLERAWAIDLRLVIVLVSYFVFLQFLAAAPDRLIWSLCRLQIIVGTVIAFFGIVQYVLAVAFHSNVLSAIAPTNESFALRSPIFRLGSERVFRSMSIFNEPSFFGFFLVPVVVKTAAALQQQLYVGTRRMHAGILAILIAAVVTNFSFTAILTLLSLTLFIVGLIARRHPKVALGAIAGALVIVATIWISPASSLAVERIRLLFQFRDLSALDRLLRVYTGTLVFLKSPWIGVGTGGYAYWYTRLGGLDYTILASPLNIWLSVLTDVGLVGMVPFFLFLANVIRRGIRNSANSPLAVVYLWTVIAYLVLLTTLDFWYLDIFWFEAAVLVRLSAGATGDRVRFRAAFSPA